MRGIRPGATAGAAVAFVVAWFLPWMGGAAAFPLLGHAFDMWYWFSFSAPGPGAGLEIVLFGLLGLVSIASAGFSARRTSAVTAALGAAVGVQVMVRDHPGLDSGPGPLVAAVALTVLAVAQAFRSEAGRSWWSTIAGVMVAALLAVATGFGGAAYASARDLDATTSDASGGVTVTALDGTFSGVTARDRVTGAERWHYWARGWKFPSVGLSGDGRTVFALAQRAGEEDAFAFDAVSGTLRWQRMLATEDWPGPVAESHNDYLSGMPGILTAYSNEARYIDGDDHESTIRLDNDCGVLTAGGVRTLYVVEDCQGRVQVFATGSDARRRWTTPALQLPVGTPAKPVHYDDIVVVDNGDTVVVEGTGSETFNAVNGNPVR